MPSAKKKISAQTLEAIEPKPNADGASILTTFKGFTKDLSCRGFQFELGKTYTISGRVEACSNGFHACSNPWDVLGYYPLLDGDANFNRFAEVEQSGAIDRHDEDSKIASASITVKAEFTIPQFIGKLVDWIVDATKPGKIEKPKVADTGRLNDNGDDGAQIGSSGNDAQIKAEGENAVVASAGYHTRVRGAAGTWVSLAEFDSEGKCVGFATGCIGKAGIAADTWLVARGGTLVAEDA